MSARNREAAMKTVRQQTSLKNRPEKLNPDPEIGLRRYPEPGRRLPRRHDRGCGERKWGAARLCE